jgi:hypothetical protein
VHVHHHGARLRQQVTDGDHGERCVPLGRQPCACGDGDLPAGRPERVEQALTALKWFLRTKK